MKPIQLAELTDEEMHSADRAGIVFWSTNPSRRNLDECIVMCRARAAFRKAVQTPAKP